MNRLFQSMLLSLALAFSDSSDENIGSLSGGKVFRAISVNCTGRKIGNDFSFS